MRRTYRVTRRLPWIENARLDPDLGVVGKHVVYSPGAEIVLKDSEVSSLTHSIEGTDEGGRRVVELAMKRGMAPARQTLVSQLPAKERKWLDRGADEALRRQNKLPELVDRILARRGEPSQADIVAALQARYPPSRELAKFVVKLLTMPLRPGPKGPSSSLTEDLVIGMYYEHALGRAKQAHARNSRKPRAFKQVAKLATAKAFGISKRSVERVLARRPSRTSKLLQ